MDLPQEFLERMQEMLGTEYGEFLRTYEEPRRFGLRVNTLKISVEDFVKLAPFHLRKIPWIDNGFCYEREDDPARHPFYYAGLYYLQEPSAMTPANILPVEPGEHVLDMCAAPGGKATALAAKLQGQGLLVANDISASRAKALLKNLEVFGVKNSFVTNAAPAKLAEQFEESFDKILVDAPCSGEGMFRKDIANAKAWSLEKVEECAKIQREITKQAVKMLRPGGLMLYSTCTFSAEENEGTIAYLLKNCPDMELIEMPMYQESFSEKEGFKGREESEEEKGASESVSDASDGRGFSCGMPQLLNIKASPALYESRCRQETWKVLEAAGVLEDAESGAWEHLKKCVRIFPHKMDGEGHFLALLKKKGELPGIHKKVQRKSGKPFKDEEKVLREFLQDVRMDWTMEQIEVRSGQVYFVPAPPEIRGGIPFLRNGLYLGELKKGRFEPSQSLAIALRGPGGNTGRNSEGDVDKIATPPGMICEYASVIDLPYDDDRIRKYLCGETIDVDDVQPERNKGWQLVCVNGYPLGWGKLVNGTLKNKYHAGWRMQV